MKNVFMMLLGLLLFMVLPNSPPGNDCVNDLASFVIDEDVDGVVMIDVIELADLDNQGMMEVINVGYTQEMTNLIMKAIITESVIKGNLLRQSDLNVDLFRIRLNCDPTRLLNKAPPGYHYLC